MYIDHMKGKLLSFILLLTAMFSLASCLSTDEDEVTYYNDTAITSFSLGTLKRVVTVHKASGDSTYTEDFDASGYAMYIDQMGGRIYNADLLPQGVDATKVICTVGTKNGGTAVIKNVDSDTLRYISSSDSIDFSQVRTVYVYANDMTARREYKVKINVHNEVGDTLIWRDKTANTAFASLRGMKAVAMAGTLYVFGTDGAATTVYSTATADGNSWTANTSQTFDADAYAGAVTDSTHLFIYSGSQVWRSADGSSWQAMGTASGIVRLLGASKNNLYALGTDNGIKVSADGGSTWADDDIEDGSNLAMMPGRDISCVTLPLKTNAGINRVTLVGNRTDNADGTAVVWAKLENTDGTTIDPWIYYEQEDENKYHAPRLNNLTAFGYDGGILALGGAGLGACTEAAFKQFYFSVDEGITWRTDSLFVLPEPFDCSQTVFAITADRENRIWIVSGSNGKVWCGRVNRLGWLRQDRE